MLLLVTTTVLATKDVVARHKITHVELREDDLFREPTLTTAHIVLYSIYVFVYIYTEKTNWLLIFIS